jgi:endonuclease YncB( thermonuclease family)
MATWRYSLIAVLTAGLTLATVIPADGQPRRSSRPSHPPSKARPVAKITKAPCTCRNVVARKLSRSQRALRAANRDRRALLAFTKQRQMLQARYLRGIRPNDERPRLLDGWQIRLIDGDTFAYEGQRIRIRGYNAPEVSEAGGFAASQRLDLLLREGPVTIIPEAKDVYGRTVADVFVNQKNVADVMTTEGYAKK